MNLKNRPPVLVPKEHWTEIERLSKAALMDMVWDYAAQTAGTEPHLCTNLIMNELRNRRETILSHRLAVQNDEVPRDGDDYADRAEWKARR